MLGFIGSFLPIFRMQIIPLGAGQDVGRSCIIASFGGGVVMLDCGMHMGYTDFRKFPDFSFISPSLSKLLDCIIVSHFHTDHCGALAYFTEKIGFHGKIYMTHPTKAICKLLLEDALKISRRASEMSYSIQDIQNCLNKVVPVDFFETTTHRPGFTLCAYPAGHVLGAAMFYVKINGESIVYTGDYNTTPDRHLPHAFIDNLRPDVFITEATYGNVVRECRKKKEREFLSSIYSCVRNGGKVLIPTFALGRAQEMCLMLDSFWTKMNLNVPILLSTGMATTANELYRLFISYTNSTVRSKILENNIFAFNHVKPLEKDSIDLPGPMVILASPGMLHSGLSLQLFLKICHDPKNMIVIPGYCVRNTVGDKVLKGEKTLEVFKKTYEVNIQVKNLAFSAHADAKGILDLITQCQPRNVLLVHGDRVSMKNLKKRIEETLKITVFAPENGTIVNIPHNISAEFVISKSLLSTIIKPHEHTKRVNLALKAVKEEYNNQPTYRITSANEFLNENNDETDA